MDDDRRSDEKVSDVTRISPLSEADRDELLAFETDNRAYFAWSVPDRGDAYFTAFDERLEHLLVLQEAGTDLFFVVRDEAGAVVGRVNLMDIENGSAELGYRIAETAAGRGHARAALRLILTEAARAGVQVVRAKTTADNVASQRVLECCGFHRVPGEPAQVEGHGGRLQEAVHYERRLAGQ